MTRNDFPTAAAHAIETTTGLPVTADHVEPIALELWDVAQTEADSEDQFEKLLCVGIASMARNLVRIVE